MRRTNTVDLDFTGIRGEFALPAEFSPEVEREAAAAVDRFTSERVDARDLPLVTIDPIGSLDLDQAVHVRRSADGYRLSYAIADVGAFIEPDSALDRAVNERGQTIYLPDENVPLHPRILSEDHASLVAGEDRPAVLWEIDADAAGNLVRARVRRATARVRERLDYAGVQDCVDRDVELPDAISALPSFGTARAELAFLRGAIELQLPTQELTREGERWRLRLEPRTQVDAWNAECSLATGVAAAALMRNAGVGILRTLPEPTNFDLQRFAAAARALGIDTAAGMAAGAFFPGRLLASLPATDLSTLALNMAATKLLRGSDYLVFGVPDANGLGASLHGSNAPGTLPNSELPSAAARWHAGVAAEYAHVTAPIRRLVDRYAAEVCLAVGGGEWFNLDTAAPQGAEPCASARAALPDWVAAALPTLPGTMARTNQLANAVNNACLNLAEATALQGREGEEFAAALLRSADDRHDAEIFAFDPPVLAQCRAAAATPVPAGKRINVTLDEVDLTRRRVRYRYQPAAADAETAD